MSVGDVLLKIAEQLNSSVFVLLAILFVAFYMVYKIGGWKQLFSDHQGRIEKIEHMATTVIKLDTTVNLIYQQVHKNFPVAAQSPISLTKSGLEIVEKIKADDIFKKHAAKLVANVEAKNPQNAYDIQTLSFDIAKRNFIELLNETELKAVKDEAFARGLQAEDVMLVFGNAVF